VWAAALVGCSLWLLGLECVDGVWGIWGGVGALGRREEGWRVSARRREVEGVYVGKVGFGGERKWEGVEMREGKIGWGLLEVW